MSNPARSQVRHFVCTADSTEHGIALVKRLGFNFVDCDIVVGEGLSDGGFVFMIDALNETEGSMRWHARLIEGAELMVKTMRLADSYTGQPDPKIEWPIKQERFGLLE